MHAHGHVDSSFVNHRVASTSIPDGETQGETPRLKPAVFNCSIEASMCNMALPKSEMLLAFNQAAQCAFSLLFENISFSDISVAIGDDKFACHKFILTAWSGYFDKMLEGKWKETGDGEIKMEETEYLTSTVFRSFHHWIYKGKLELTLDNVRQLLPAAHYLLIDNIIDLCVDHIKSCYNADQVPLDSIVDDLCMAIKYEFRDLQTVILKSIAQHYEDLCRNEKFLDNVEVKEMAAILKHDELASCSEDFVLETAITWILHGGRDRLEQLDVILDKIRLGLVTIPTIRKLDYTVMSHSEHGFGLLQDALFRTTDEASMQRMKESRPYMFTPRQPMNKNASAPVTSMPVSEPALFAENVRKISKRLRNAPSDVIVKVGAQDFPCHIRALVGWSDYFHRMLVSDKSPELDVHVQGEGITAEAFSLLLDWMYKGELPITPENICDLLSSARYLQINSAVTLLESYCSQTLASYCDTIRGGDIIGLYCQAKKQQLEPITTMAFNGILRNFEKVSQSEEFVSLLPLDDLLSLLCSEELTVSSEDVVFLAALAWLRHDKQRMTHLGQLLELVRIWHVQVATINRNVDFEVISQSAESSAILMRAMARMQDPEGGEYLKMEHPTIFMARKAVWRKVLIHSQSNYVVGILDTYGDNATWVNVNKSLLSYVPDEVAGILDTYGDNATWVDVNKSLLSYVPDEVAGKVFAIISSRLHEYEVDGDTWKVTQTEESPDGQLACILGGHNGFLYCVTHLNGTQKLVISRLHMPSRIWELAAELDSDIQKRLADVATVTSTVRIVQHGGCIVRNTLLLLVSYQITGAVRKHAVVEMEIPSCGMTAVTPCPAFAQPVSSIRVIEWKGQGVALVTMSDVRAACTYITSEKTNGRWEQREQQCLSHAPRMWLIGKDVVFVGDNGAAMPTNIATRAENVTSGSQVKLPATWQTANGASGAMYCISWLFVGQ